MKDGLDNLRDRQREFVAERDWQQFHTPKNLSMALAGEAAEILEIFQWLTSAQSRQLSPEKLDEVREEIGDVLIYLVRLADELGLDPLDAAFKKIERNREKYPADLVRGRSDKYTEYNKDRSKTEG